MTRKNQIKPKLKTNFTSVYIGLALVTLAFNPQLLDPFNNPKLWILTLFGSWFFGRFLYFVVLERYRLIKFYLFPNVLIYFVTSLFLVSLFSQDKFKAFIGQDLRRNAFLAYASLAVFSYISYFRFSHTRLKQSTYRYIFLISILEGFYCYLQYIKEDPISWNNPYNPVIGTLGNPNFSSAVLAMLCSFMFSAILNSELTNFNRIIYGSTSVVLYFLTWKTNSFQGRLSAIFGICTFLLLVLINKRSKLALPIFGISGFALLLVVLGIFNIGPAASILYKETVSIRAYYWRAGIKMFTSHPLFGVGVDNYGDFFKQYRDLTYAQKYGYEIISTNAHNLPIQILSTCGIFVFIFFAIIFLTPVVKVFRIVRARQADLTLLGLVAFYVSFLSQSLVSIDNIGISIMGWFAVGVIIKYCEELSKSNTIPNNLSTIARKSVAQNMTLFELTTSLVATVVSFIFVSQVYVLDGQLKSIRMELSQPAGSPISSTFHSRILALTKNSLVDPAYKYELSNALSSTGDIPNAILVLSKLINNNPRNQDALRFRAELYEFQKNFSQAIIDRSKLEKLDPWNAANLLKLAQDHLALGNVDLGKMYLIKVVKFAGERPESSKAKELLLTVTK